MSKKKTEKLHETLKRHKSRRQRQAEAGRTTASSVAQTADDSTRVATGATDWLRTHTQPAAAQARLPQRISAVTPSEKSKLLAMPRYSCTWQVDFRQTPNLVNDAGEIVRGRIVLILEPNSGFMLAADIIDKPFTADELWKSLTKCMRKPSVGAPQHRPAALQVRPGDVWQALRPRLQELNIELQWTDTLNELDAAWEEMRACFPDDPDKGLLDTPGVAPAAVGAVFAAAADFYRAAPWRRLQYDSILEVACSKFPGGPKYAIVMGQAGMTFGLTLYDELNLLRKMLTGQFSDSDAGRRTQATALTFGTEAEIPFADLEAAQRHGWPIADPSAHPWFFRKEPGQDPRPPAPWQLDMLEAAIRAIPDFVSRRRQSDTTREEVTVKTAQGEAKVGLRWLEI